MEIPDLCPFGRNAKAVCASTLLVSEILWFGRQISEKKQTCKHLANKYKIAETALYGYAKAYSEGTVLYPGTGRPPILSPKEESKLISFLRDGDYQIRTIQFNEKVQELANV